LAADLTPFRVPVFRDIPSLLQQGKVYGRLDVTHDSWVSVPVPRTAKSPSAIDDTDIRGLKSGLDQAVRKQESIVTSTDDQELDATAMLKWRFLTSKSLVVNERIFPKIHNIRGAKVNILCRHIGAKTLRSFLGVFPSQLVLVCHDWKRK
jgi:hypothetical protein